MRISYKALLITATFSVAATAAPPVPTEACANFNAGMDKALLQSKMAALEEARVKRRYPIPETDAALCDANRKLMRELDAAQALGKACTSKESRYSTMKAVSGHVREQSMIVAQQYHCPAQ